MKSKYETQAREQQRTEERGVVAPERSLEYKDASKSCRIFGGIESLKETGGNAGSAVRVRVYN